MLVVVVASRPAKALKATRGRNWNEEYYFRADNVSATELCRRAPTLKWQCGLDTRLRQSSYEGFLWCKGYKQLELFVLQFAVVYMHTLNWS